MSRPINKSDAESLCTHIEGHIFWAKEAIAAGKADMLEEQAAEIISWAQSLKAIARDAN